MMAQRNSMTEADDDNERRSRAEHARRQREEVPCACALPPAPRIASASRR